MAGWVVGVYDDDGTCGGVTGGGQAIPIENPLATGFVKRVGDRGEAFGLDEKFEQRIGGLGKQDLGAGVGDEFEAEGIGFAGAGGEKQVVRGDVAVEVFRVVERDGFPGMLGTGGGRGVGGGGWREAGVGEIEIRLGGVGD